MADFSDIKEITGQDRANRARKYFVEFIRYANSDPRLQGLFARMVFMMTDNKGAFHRAFDVEQWLHSENRVSLSFGGTKEIKELFDLYWLEHRRSRSGE
jgi:hypothetical protein